MKLWRGMATTMACAVLVAACSEDDNGTGPGDGLVGTWNATTFNALGQDFIALGMDLTLTLTSGGTYTIQIAGDLIGACEPDPSCSETGEYTATSTQLTFDPDDPDPTIFTYTIQGSTLNLTGSIDGTPVSITLTRT